MIKNHNLQISWLRKLILCILCLVSCVLCPLYAKEINILYTGSTHSMLYPCSCPKEPDGGIARRATLIEELRKANPGTLVLDSGGFFAGGLLDEYTQNSQLDMQRTGVNLKAMELMKYDGACLGNDEFNFGRDFLQKSIDKTRIPFLSCNVKLGNVSPFIIKEISGTKIGVVGVSNPLAMQKSEGIEIAGPRARVRQATEELKKQGADIIILLSYLNYEEELNLINDISGIDIVISGSTAKKEDDPQKIGSAIYLKPSWQGRSLGKLSLTIEGNKIVSHKIEQVRLSDKISDSPVIQAILPDCFSDFDCNNKDRRRLGTCQNSGTLESRCIFAEPAKIKLLVIVPKPCITCSTEGAVGFLKSVFPGLVTSYVYYPERKADKLMKGLDINGLPAYLLEKGVEKDKNFDRLKANLQAKGDYYMLKPEFIGLSYFPKRERKKQRLDLFISLYDNSTARLLDETKDLAPIVHFLVAAKDNNFTAAGGAAEVEESLRSVCVQKYYPEKFRDYIKCRANNINSSWWEDCLGASGTDKIKACAKGPEGGSLLRENIKLNQELMVMFGPTYMLDNQEIFSSQGIPPAGELRKIIKKK